MTTELSKEQKLSKEDDRAFSVCFGGVCLATLGAAIIWGPGGIFLVIGVTAIVFAMLDISSRDKDKDR